jgi:hypothetical protein
MAGRPCHRQEAPQGWWTPCFCSFGWYRLLNSPNRAPFTSLPPFCCCPVPTSLLSFFLLLSLLFSLSIYSLAASSLRSFHPTTIAHELDSAS